MLASVSVLGRAELVSFGVVICVGIDMFIVSFTVQFACLCDNDFCHVKLMSGVLSLEVREQTLCSGLCNSAVTSIVYLFTSFLGSEVNVEPRCIVHRVNIHILICTLNVRETSDDWQTGIFNISCTSRGFCRGCL